MVLSEEEKEERDEIYQRINWSIQRQLTWIGLTLASGIGIIELLPHITSLISFKSLLYEFLALSIVFSLPKIVDYTHDIRRLRSKLVKFEWSEVKESDQPIVKVLDKIVKWILRNRRKGLTILLLCLFGLAQLFLLEQLELFKYILEK